MSEPEYTIDDERRFFDWLDDPISTATALRATDRTEAVQIGFQAGWDAAKHEQKEPVSELARAAAALLLEADGDGITAEGVQRVVAAIERATRQAVAGSKQRMIRR